jgi:hypothetical protein
LRTFATTGSRRGSKALSANEIQFLRKRLVRAVLTMTKIC